jgi:DNA-binding response OmpR family regulator
MLAAVLIEECDHEVILAANGREALDKLADEPVDALICDVNMPIMNGDDLVRAIRADPALHELPVVLTSAGAYLDRVDPELGVDLMLEKPFDISVLLACLTFVLDRVRAGRRSVRVSRRRAASSIHRMLLASRREHWGKTTVL